MILAANLLWVSLRQSRSLAVRRKRAMWSSVSSVMPSPNSGHGAAIVVGLVRQGKFRTGAKSSFVAKSIQIFHKKT